VAERKAKKAAAPKRGRPQGRDAHATRAMIVQAARVLFGIHGYSATTVKMVAQRAGMSFQAVYYHFSGIEEIYDAVVADVIARLEQPVHDVFAESTLRSQIRTYAFAMHALDYEDRTVMAFMIREYLDARRDRQRGKGPLVEGTEQFFVALVKAAIARGELAPDTDLPAVVGVLTSIMWGIGLYAGFIDDSDQMARVTDAVDGVIAHGLPWTSSRCERAQPVPETARQPL
jgi:AcrR family transcriptional regulator